MRTSDLITAPVYDVTGAHCGIVIDVRTRPDRGTLVVEGVIVADRARRLLGFERRRQPRPFVLRVLMDLLHRNTGFAARDRFEVDEDGTVTLHCRREDLPHVSEI
ncbi:hypothetical protein LX16_3759 [Stackebrandtia albiflava]|uniref:Uncharacterized protein n=1 Tax=Stackebrandtia albiflava TaxID=406432 RepID=A0A562V586_9ACTN|nr:hypothetical protein [Stackebrandtia albiflava]TWJ12992.1 hypothetical protein LX16_3759 [Stackebrandtia albiflava]